MDPVANTRGVSYAICVVLAACVASLVFPAYLCIVPKAKKQVDPEYRSAKSALPISTTVSETYALERHATKKSKFKLLGLRKRDGVGTEVEHVERRYLPGEPAMAKLPGL